MSEKNKRPVNLNLMSFKFPPTALVSIGHRISGVVLFLAIPVLLYILDQAFLSPNHFTQFLLMVSQNIIVKIIVWLTLLAIIYHLLAGTRHLIMDMGYGESFKVARITALILFFIFAVKGWRAFGICL